MSWLEKLEIIFEHNDLLSMDVEAIACPVTVDLREYGRISQELFEICQASFINDLSEIRESLPNQRLVLGEAIAINFKPAYLIGNYKILIFVGLWDTQNEYNFMLFYKSYINSLRRAFEHDIKSIALPVMAYDSNISLCGDAIIKVIHDLDNLKISHDFPIEEIYFVSKNIEHINFLDRNIAPKLY